MKFAFLIPAAATALLLAGCDKAGGGNTAAPGAAANQIATVAPPQGVSDWTQVVTQTPEGGFRMGNPNAPVKLVEFASMTCPVCRKFSAEATGKLEQNYVRTGQVSFEFRNFVFNQVDVISSLLARCGGPAPFFKLTEQMFANQDAMQQRVQERSAELQAAEALPGPQTFVRVAQVLDLEKFVGMRGIPASKANACLTNEAELNKLVAMQQAGIKDFKVAGTPTFLINGSVVPDAITWADLEPRIKTALGA